MNRAKTLLSKDWRQAIAEGADFRRLTEHEVTATDEQRLCHAVVILHDVMSRRSPSDAVLLFRSTLNP